VTPGPLPSGYALSPEAIDAVSRPTLEASTLPPECYSDPLCYRRELERIFANEWICVGRVEDVPQVGDFVTTSIGEEPVVVVRDGTGTIRAHLNVCRHRRCALVEGTGSVKSFRCPYHGWMYALDGTLRATPAFKETLNFDKADYPLMSAKVELWQGFILVNLDVDATNFASRVSDSTKWGADRYRMGEMVTTHRWEYQVECNWKAYVENYTESYHVPWVHPETFDLLTPLKRWIEFPDITAQHWALQIGQTPGITFSDSGDALFTVSPDLEGIDVEFDGMPVWLVFPTMMVIPTVDALLYYVAFPEGPERMRLRAALCVPPDVAAQYLEAQDADVLRNVEEYLRNVQLFLEEDNKICRMQHIGMRSLRGEPGRFCKHEGLARMFDEWVADRAYGPATPS
jgi:phenylpropionate dioxygenase-like ring-hydroxylating dioxygenase large terminal subunit